MRSRATRSSIGAWAIASLALVVSAAAPGAAVDLHGTLHIPDGYATLGVRPSSRPRFYWEEWNGALDPRMPRADVPRTFVVVLTGGTVGPTAPPIVRLSGGSLLPATVVVRVGAVLRLENRDDFAHEIYAEGLEGFSAEATSSGQARTVSLRAPGHWTLHDRVVGHVQGDLHVIPDLAAVATLEADGRFTFAGVAAGTYTLKVFAGPNVVVNQPMQIAEGREVTLEPIALPPPPAAH